MRQSINKINWGIYLVTHEKSEFKYQCSYHKAELQKTDWAPGTDLILQNGKPIELQKKFICPDPDDMACHLFWIITEGPKDAK